jgi:hypothetical protein
VRKVKRYWPDVDPQEIMAILDQYGAEGSETGRDRVHLAILKLSEGQLERLPDLVAAAKVDYRDIVAAAEYPGQLRLGFVGMRELSPEERRALRRQDKAQYRKWLRE